MQLNGESFERDFLLATPTSPVPPFTPPSISRTSAVAATRPRRR
ncbi:hypothetical protein [Streptomyces sp. NPDC127108]